jgi:beta-N-acetylhexosaminidase
VDAVRSGRVPASRLEESASRVAELRNWLAAARPTAATTPAVPASPDHPAAPITDADVGLTAARRALRLDGTVRPLRSPVLVEIVPPSNIAVGTVPWGLSTWLPAADVHRISTGAVSPDAVAEVLAAAAGRPLIVVVRDGHRYAVAQDVVLQLLAARPDTVVVEMGLPVWRPQTEVYLATFGATRASSRAAAEILGLIHEVRSSGADRS